jgi:hypothetical protein
MAGLRNTYVGGNTRIQSGILKLERRVNLGHVSINSSMIYIQIKRGLSSALY